MTTRLLVIHALSPIHCGTGQAIGGIDLPIAREKPTQLPLIPGSSIKGVLRARPSKDPQTHAAVFGPDTENASDNAGSVQFGDALLTFLPVRSMRGTFAWVTSPFMLRRVLRDAKALGIEIGNAPEAPGENEALVAGPKLKAGDRVVFEDFDFAAKQSDAWKALAAKFAERLHGTAKESAAERQMFVDRACVVHDDVMAVLLQTCTEIAARIRLNNETKTVETGALWTEEALPVESVLVGLVTATPVLQKGGAVPKADLLLQHVHKLLDGALQLGGNATVGRGLCRIRMEG
jgi:CRISPR-associated protein Cmr4